MKYTELSSMSRSDLSALLKTKKTDLFSLKIKQKTMQLQNTSELRTVKKEIAQINTALSAAE